MLDVFLNFILQFRHRDNIKRIKSQSKNVNKKFKSLLIICPKEEYQNQELFLDFANQLNISCKKVTLVVLSKKEIVEIKKTPFIMYFISKKSIGFFGKMPDLIKELFKKKFDLQINFFNHRSIFHEFISTSCSSKIRVGFSKSNHQINDLILDIDLKQHKLFLTESKIFLNAILNK
tara:strand:- start:6450 stop:6977 length:528 start_codon:yes stop_codon:yes gene_type:complete